MYKQLKRYVFSQFIHVLVLGYSVEASIFRTPSLRLALGQWKKSGRATCGTPDNTNQKSHPSP